MLQDANRDKQIIIIPHWKIGGGSGLYNNDLINSLSKYANIRIAGIFAGEYTKYPLTIKLLNEIGSLSLPTYDGIKLISIFYNIIVSFLKIILIKFSPFIRRPDLKCDSVIFTSSVQVLAIPIMKSLYPEIKVNIIIQEQVNLSQGFGKLTALLLRQNDTVISISNAWAEHAAKHGIKCFVLRNSYEKTFVDVPKCLPSQVSDVLYVGGDAEIKGFKTLVEVLPNLLRKPNNNIICLGSYSNKSKLIIKRINEASGSKSNIQIIGFSADIRPYLKDTKILLLPIKQPHFCRPAIEAGLLGKTFIISDFCELSDFVLPNYNCLTYTNGDISTLVNSIERLLSDNKTRRRLEMANWLHAQNFLADTQIERGLFLYVTAQ